MTLLADQRKKSIDTLKRMEGLARKVREMLEQDSASCPKILEQVLALMGHVKHLQGLVLESHLQTCAADKLRSKEKNAFIRELLRAIGHSTR